MMVPESTFQCAECHNTFHEHTGGSQCPNCGRIFCWQHGDIKDQDLGEHLPSFERVKTFCKFCRSDKTTQHLKLNQVKNSHLYDCEMPCCVALKRPSCVGCAYHIRGKKSDVPTV